MRRLLLAVLSLQFAATFIARYDPAWAVCLNPLEVAPRAKYADMLTAAGHAPEAIVQALILTRLHPNDPTGWQLLAQAHIRAHDLKSAEAAMVRASELDPTFPAIVSGLAAIRMVGKQ